MNDEKMNEKQQAQSNAAPNKPIDVLRDGALKTAIFKNEKEGKAYFSITSGRVYTDASGNVRETKTIGEHDALKMSKLIDKSYDRIGEFKKQLKEKENAEKRER